LLQLKLGVHADVISTGHQAEDCQEYQAIATTGQNVVEQEWAWAVLVL
jgi:hypothetical protein